MLEMDVRNSSYSLVRQCSMDLFELIITFVIHLGSMFPETLLSNLHRGLACKDVLVPVFQGGSAEELRNVPRAKE